MTRTVRALFVLLAAILANPNALLACVCADSGSVEQQVRAAQIVVVGRVVSLAIATTEVEGQKIESTVATIEVERRWKGPKTDKVQVSTCGTQAVFCTCGVPFQLGGTYIVVTDDGTRVSSCGVTTEYSPDNVLLVTLDAMFKPHR